MYKNYRYYVLLALFAISLVLLISVPSEKVEYWFMTFFGTKLIGILLFSIGVIVTKKWYKGGELPELEEYIEE